MTEARTCLCPAKLILFGEHSVMAGHLCIAIAINRYGRLVEIKDGPSNAIVIDKRGLEMEFTNMVKNKAITISLDVPLGSGLGSSAIISLITAFFHSGNILDNAIKIENRFHKKTSGVDIYTSYLGGMIAFKSREVERLPSSFLKKYKVIIFDTGVAKNTAIANSKPVNMDIIERIRNVTERACDLLKRDFTLAEIYDMIRENQDLLEELGVCHKQAQKEILRMRRQNIECKVTGAGYGGHIYTIVDKHQDFENWDEVEIDESGFACQYTI